MLQKLLFGGLLVLFAACAPTPAPTAEPTEAVEGRTLVLGEISEDPDETIRAFQPLANYLAANLTDYGVTSGEVRVAPDLDTMAMYMASGEVNITFDSLYPVLIISDATGAQPILRRWKDGVEEYTTIFFTASDSGVASLDDLRGRVIAFDTNFSTSGYMVPLAYLVEAGFSAVEVDSPDAEVADDQIGYVFSGDDDNTMQWVVSGRVAAGVTDNGNYSELPEDTRDTLTVIAETNPVPRHVVLVSPDLDVELVAAISAVLVAMDESEAGRAVLETFEETARFDDFPQGIEQGLAEMRAMYDLVQGQPAGATQEP